jgi:adenylate cyclase
MIGQTTLEVKLSLPDNATDMVESESELTAAIDKDDWLAEAIASDYGPRDAEPEPHAPEPRGNKLETIHRPLRTVTDSVPKTFFGLRNQLTPHRLLRWVEMLIAVQRAPAGSMEFYEQTVHAMIELVGLDFAMILLRQDNDWKPVTVQGRMLPGQANFSGRVIDAVVREKRTFYQVLEGRSDQSLTGIGAVVASPIFDLDQEVFGIIYGARQELLGSTNAPIGPLEAQVVQLLATTMESGLTRAWHDAELARVRHRFEEFFSPDVAAEIERNPRLLEGQQREVTVLFLDIRGFSTLAERLPPRDVYRLAQDVMDRITAQIEKSKGVVVDYAGDGVLAMWNAPTEQSDHAGLACAAALDIYGELPALDQEWRQLSPEPMRIGIGINTGPAQVGNAGSRTRMKYGPRGHTVNLGSRTEGATKHLGIGILITGTTRAKLGDRFAVRRLCKGRVVGLEETVDLYELRGIEADPEWLELKAAYEIALTAFETGRWNEALQRLHSIIVTDAGKNDLPTLSLLGRTVDCIRSPKQQFDPVVELKEK